MRFSVTQDRLIKPLQRVVNVVERRQTKPILGNILLSLKDDELTLTSTDLEIEMRTQLTVSNSSPGEVTVPARKLLDITRSLPTDADVSFSLDKQRAVLTAGRSRFTLSTLPASGYPNVEIANAHASFTLPEKVLAAALDRTAFAMAQQDVRYYLNGMLMEISDEGLRLVATDGHRLAICDLPEHANDIENQRIIIPRKGIQELGRLLADSSGESTVTLGSNFIQVGTDNGSFISKLINGIYPDYHNVIPQTGECNAICDREDLRSALVRVGILSNEQYRGVRMRFSAECLILTANNPEHEEAEEELAIEYAAADLDIAFNVAYLIEALSVCEGDKVKINLTDSNSCCLIEPVEACNCRYIVMPMRL